MADIATVNWLRNRT